METERMRSIARTHIWSISGNDIGIAAAFRRYRGSGWSSTASWDHTHCQTHLLKPSSSTRKPQNGFQQMPQPRLFHIFTFFLNSLPERFLSGRSYVLLGYQLEAHRGHGALKWRAQAVHKCLSDVFQAVSNIVKDSDKKVPVQTWPRGAPGT